ncbi:Bcr/CflA family drug resistance efflux transporter [Pelomonas sp. HMWF004]|nr:Bcr/CflA family drug resistance efflux transporter [Pelomonas sp. HMWF004]
MRPSEDQHPAHETAVLPRMTVLGTVTLLLSLHPLAGYLYLPALPALRERFAASTEATQWTLSAFLIGFGLTQLMWGWLADRLGRRPVLLVGLMVFLVAAIGCLSASRMLEVVAWRALQGASVAAAGVCARALLRDLYQPTESVRMLSIGFSGLSAVAVAAPICGAALVAQRGAAASFELLAAIGAAALVYVAINLPETVSDHRSGRVAQRPGMPLLRIAHHRLFRAYTALTACTYTGHYLFLMVSSFWLIDRHELSVFQYGLVLAFGSIVHLLGTFACRRWLVTRSVRTTVAHAAWLTFASGSTMGLLALAGVDAAWALIAPQLLYVFAHAVHQSCGQAAVMAPFPDCAGTATGLSGTVLPLVAVGVASMLAGPLSASAMALPLGMATCAVLTAAVAWTLVQRDGALDDDGNN